MSTPHSADVLAAFRDFVARLDELDPQAPMAGELTVGLGDGAERLPLRLPVARALTEALRGYHDPRERGSCAHCAGGRLDDDFVCRTCGIVNGLFGQTIARFVTDGQAARQPELGGPRDIPGAARPAGNLGD
ncbi:hypothetical protein [Actinoplanes sp. ATCC 53533]|uniref:hypothetical protein n=1 Tax=Actinoplanes sp. ATCC 53533 TaxID=1288362 RepID=UPI0018F5BD64|nr:hypothetical protein [Actinoplanes sp. ATCC 53533]